MAELDPNALPPETPSLGQGAGSTDVMSGTPAGSAEIGWEAIKDDLLVPGSDEPQGQYDIEGLDRAVALHNIVGKYPIYAAPQPDIKDKDINQEVLLSDDVMRDAIG